MSKYRAFLIWGSLLAVLFFLSLYFNKDSFTQLLRKYNLYPKPESFTELYFENHLKLPKLFKLNEPNSFRFTVHNLENKDFTYHYTVNAVATDSASLLDKGTFTLKHNQSKTIKEKFTIRLPHQKVKLNVSLDNKTQDIHFYTEIIW